MNTSVINFSAFFPILPNLSGKGHDEVIFEDLAGYSLLLHMVDTNCLPQGTVLHPFPKGVNCLNY